MTETAAPTGQLKHTALFPLQQQLGAKFVDFHGWELPLHFAGILKEHEAVRTAAGLFDVSHMGQYIIEGPPAFAFLQKSIPTNLTKAKPGKAIYTHILNEKGGVVDDVIIYCLAPERYFMVVNAANTEKDYNWMRRLGVSEDFMFENASQMFGMLALQGPKAAEILATLVPEAVKLPFFGVLDKEVYARPTIIARTGYTGEDGFEIIASNEVITRWWQDLLAKGNSLGLQPCGLGARDTLRLEAGLPLYGQDLTEEYSPIAAGFEWIVDVDAANFTGKDAMLLQKKEGVARRLKGFRLMGPGVPRPGAKVFLEGKELGTLSSATFSPTLKTGIGVGYMMRPSSLGDGTMVKVEVHGGQQADAIVMPLPFYKPKKK